MVMDDYYKGLLFSLCGNVAINVGHHLRAAGEDRDSIKKPGQKFIHGKIARRNQQRSCWNCLIRRRSSEDGTHGGPMGKHSSKNGTHHTSKNDHNNGGHHYYSPFHSGYTDTTCVFCISRKIIFWLIGYVLFIGGSVSNAYALAFAPQTLLASMGSVQFIVNLFCSWFFHHRPVRWVHLLGTLCVVIGCVTLVVGFNPRGASDDEGATTIVDLYNNFNRRLYRNYLCAVLIVFCVTLALSKLEEYLVTQCCGLFNTLCMLATLSSGTSAGSAAAAMQQSAAVATLKQRAKNTRMRGSKHDSGNDLVPLGMLDDDDDGDGGLPRNHHHHHRHHHFDANGLIVIDNAGHHSQMTTTELSNGNMHRSSKKKKKNSSSSSSSSSSSMTNHSTNGGIGSGSSMTNGSSIRKSQKRAVGKGSPKKRNRSTEWHSLWNKIGAVLYSIGSAMPGTQSVVLGKALAIIVRRTLSGHIAWNSSTSDIGQIVFVCIVGVSWLVTIVFWLYRQHDSTSKFSPELIIPLNQACWILFSTISGGIYFQEFKRASLGQLISLGLGLLLIFAGLFNLVSTHASNDSESRMLTKLSRSIKNMDKLPSSRGNRRRGGIAYAKLHRKRSESYGYTSDDCDEYHHYHQNSHYHPPNDEESGNRKRQYLYDPNNRSLNAECSEMIGLLESHHRSEKHPQSGSEESDIATSSEDISEGATGSTSNTNSIALMKDSGSKKKSNYHHTSSPTMRPKSGSKLLRKIRKRMQMEQEQMEREETSSEELRREGLKFGNEREEIQKLERASINSSSSVDFEKERRKELAELRAHLERQQKRQLLKLYKNQGMEEEESEEESQSLSSSLLSPIVSSRNGSQYLVIAAEDNNNKSDDGSEEEEKRTAMRKCDDDERHSTDMVVIVDDNHDSQIRQQSSIMLD